MRLILAARLSEPVNDTRPLAIPSTIQWNGTGDAGNPESTGVYFCLLLTGNYTKTIKMEYLR